MGSRGGRLRAVAAVALCFWLLLAATVGGCRRRAPAAPAKGAKSATKAATGGDESGKAPAKGAKKGSPGAPANAPAATATGAGAKAESPFPGQSGSTRSAAKAGAPAPAPPKEARVAARRDPDTIPGVPKMTLPNVKRSPFRLQGDDEGPSPTKQPSPAMAFPPKDLGKAPGDMAQVGPLPPVPYALQEEGGPGQPGTARSTAMATAAAPALPALQLTGIINGAPRMAVIEGEKAHYIVREGDLIAGGYRVTSISPYKVILLSGDSRSLVLRFGRKGG